MSLSIPGLSPLPPGLDRIGTPQRGGRASEAAVPRPELRPESGSAARAPHDPGGAAEVPPGTDPELWAVLTTEERAHFSRLRSMGPLTYGSGPDSGPAAPTRARRGVRLDVRA